MKPVPRQTVDLALIAGDEPPALPGVIACRVAGEHLGSIVPRIDGNGEEAEVLGLRKVVLELSELKALRRAGLGALGVDEVDHRNMTEQVVSADAARGALCQGEGRNASVAIKMLEAHLRRWRRRA